MMRGGIQSIATLPQERAKSGSTVARRLINYLQPYWRTLLIVLGLVIIGAVTQAGGPYLIGRAIDGAIGQRDSSSLNQTMLMLLGVYIAGADADDGRGRSTTPGSAARRDL